MWKCGTVCPAARPSCPEVKRVRRHHQRKAGQVVWGAITAPYLTSNGEPVCLVCALDDAPDALDGMHELCQFVRAQVGEARDGTRRAYQHVYELVQYAARRAQRGASRGGDL